MYASTSIRQINRSYNPRDELYHLNHLSTNSANLINPLVPTHQRHKKPRKQTPPYATISTTRTTLRNPPKEKEKKHETPSERQAQRGGGGGEKKIAYRHAAADSTPLFLHVHQILTGSLSPSGIDSCARGLRRGSIYKYARTGRARMCLSLSLFLGDKLSRKRNRRAFTPSLYYGPA